LFIIGWVREVRAPLSRVRFAGRFAAALDNGFMLSGIFSEILVG
jgi:hypothetical protein